jgi:hypothetical protein
VIRPEQFVREHLNFVISDVNRHLLDLGETVNPTFLEVRPFSLFQTFTKEHISCESWGGRGGEERAQEEGKTGVRNLKMGGG